MTARTLFAVAAFAALSGWVSGQGPRRIADEEATLLKKNRRPLEGLLDDGLALTVSETALDRAAACRRATDRLTTALAEAARGDDADRVNEIGDQLTALLSDGFLPPFAAARAEIRAESPEFPRLQALHGESAAWLKAAVDAVPTTGTLADRPRVAALREKLAALAVRVGSPAE
jgi:hypothetical protein